MSTTFSHHTNTAVANGPSSCRIGPSVRSQVSFQTAFVSAVILNAPGSKKTFFNFVSFPYRVPLIIKDDRAPRCANCSACTAALHELITFSLRLLENELMLSSTRAPCVRGLEERRAVLLRHRSCTVFCASCVQNGVIVMPSVAKLSYYRDVVLPKPVDGELIDVLRSFHQNQVTLVL